MYFIDDNTSINISDTQTYLVVIDRTISLLRQILWDVDDDDRQEWQVIEGCFESILEHLQKYVSVTCRPTSITTRHCNVRRTGMPGRPSFHIEPEMLEDLLGLGFSQQRISKLCGVSRWTIYRRIQEYNLHHLTEFSNLSDEEIDQILESYITRHGRTTGQVLIIGYLRSQGIHLPRRRVRESIARVDPANAALRWGAAVYRRSYQVPWANSLWHLDGHHSLIRWSLVVHGCIDGFSRMIIFLHCSSNNLSTTV